MSISTVLFVCTGNTCRSPLAEGIAQKWLDENGFSDWLAVSAGVFASEGCPTSEETIKALSQRGITFNGTSKGITKKMATSATAILCMSRSHLATVNQFVDNAELLDPSGDILDPVGQDQSVYDALAEQMDILISTKLTSLTNKGLK
jgi:protein-tyrosine-phosphatase